MKPIPRLLLSLFGTALLAAMAPARAADFPTKPVRLVVGYAAGGATDLVARALGRSLSERWGQPVVVDNRPGAGGNIGSDAVAKATPDGHTVVMIPPAFAVNASLFKKLPFDPVADFKPVGMVAVVLNVFVVTPSLPAKTVAEFVQYAKKNPGTINFASAGIGASSHMAGELFKSYTGIDMVHVPYRGTSQYIPDIISGKVQASFDTLSALLPHIQSGSLRAMALSSASRSPLLPDVPTMKEAGLPEYQVSVWLGLYAPAGTPDATIRSFNQSLNAALQTPALAKQIADIGGVATTSTPEEFGSFVKREMDRYREVVVRTGATAN